MKTILFYAAILFSFSATAQKKLPGPITYNDTITIVTGDKIQLGKGSGPKNGQFKYVYYPASLAFMTDDLGVDKTFTNKTITVKSFKNAGDKHLGPKTLIVFGTSSSNAVIDLLPAIQAGEVIAINQKPIAAIKKETTTPSAADELAKWKKLYDDGVITKEEYEAKKKKILEGN